MKRVLSSFLVFIFLVQSVLADVALAQVLPLPAVNSVQLSQPFFPSLIRGVTLHPDNPLKFDFIVDPGEDKLQDDAFQKESMKLIKYFLVSLTTPEGDMWVNLSPTEKDRIIPDEFGKTEMGRDLLLQDYTLKQLTAAFLNPKEKLGAEFWNRVYQESKDKLGLTDIPVETLKKVWIVPDKAEVYVQGKSVFVVGSHLKVMMEDEYKSGQWTVNSEQRKNSQSTVHSPLFTEIIIPALEREVNEGKNFALLRQIQNSAILAAWYKKNLAETFLGKVYVDQKKTEGVNSIDKSAALDIYNQYLEVFKKGAYEYVKEDYNPETQEVVSRKFVSGGIMERLRDQAMTVKDLTSGQDQILKKPMRGVSVQLQQPDQMMAGKYVKDRISSDSARTDDGIKRREAAQLADNLPWFQAKPNKRIFPDNYRLHLEAPGTLFQAQKVAGQLDSENEFMKLNHLSYAALYSFSEKISEKMNAFAKQKLDQSTGPELLERFLMKMYLQFLSHHRKHQRLKNRLDKLRESEKYHLFQEFIQSLFHDSFQKRLHDDPFEAISSVYISIINLDLFENANHHMAHLLMNLLLLKAGYIPFFMNYTNSLDYLAVVYPQGLGKLHEGTAVSQTIDPAQFKFFLSNHVKSFQEAVKSFKPRHIEKLFDLRIVNGEHLTLDHIDLAAHKPDVDMIRVTNPHPKYRRLLKDYSYKPSKITYTLNVPQLRTGEGVEKALDRYYVQLKSKLRKALRRDVKTIERKIASGELELIIDRGDNDAAKEEFDSLYDAVMSTFPKAVKGIPFEGHRFGVYVKENGRMIAGTIAHEDTRIYNLRQMAIDREARMRIPNLQFFVVQQVLRQAIRRGDKKMMAGADPNFYGYHVSPGVMQWKVRQGWVPRLVTYRGEFGSHELLKITNFNKFGSPIFFFNFPQDMPDAFPGKIDPVLEVRESTLIITPEMANRIHEFEGITPTLNLFVFKNGELVRTTKEQLADGAMIAKINPNDKVGLIVGKFAPFHKGHEMLIREALKQSDKVVLLLYNHPELSDVPVEEMADLVRKIINDDRLIVKVAYDAPPSGDTEKDRQANVDYIKSQIPGIKIEKVFNNEWYGKDVANALDAEVVRVDEKRSIVPVSAEDIRRDLEANKDYLHPLVYERLKRAQMFPESQENRSFKERVDAGFIERPLDESEKEVIRQKVLELNPGYDREKLLGRLLWDTRYYQRENLPSLAGEIQDKEMFSINTGKRILDMPIYMPGQGWAIPKAVEQFQEAIRIAVNNERSINPDVDDYYVYITVDQKIIEPNKSQRRYGYHGDAFITSANTDMEDEIITDDTYVIFDDLSSEFSAGPFDLSDISPDDDEGVLRRFQETAEKKGFIQYPAYKVLKLTPYDVHTPSINHSDKPIKRTFVKIAFSKEKYNMLGNKMNPLLNYDNWTWVPRDPAKRNHRNIIVDWNREDKDDFIPIDTANIDFTQDRIDVPWARPEVFWAKKQEGVRAERAQPGEVIETRVNGFVVTLNIAQAGDWKITTSQKDQYFLNDKKFKARYFPEPNSEGVYMPTGKPQRMVLLTKPVRKRSSWGAMQYVPAGSVLVYVEDETEGGHTYAIHKDNFEASYVRTDQDGNILLGQKMDASFLDEPTGDAEALRKQMIDLNPLVDPAVLFSVPEWKMKGFEDAHLPVVVSEIENTQLFSRYDQKRRVRVLDLLIYAPDQGWAIPEELAQFKEVILKAVEAERLANPDFRNRFVHITIDQKDVEPEAFGRRPGLHMDMSLTDEEGLQVDVTAHNKKYMKKKSGKSDQTYFAYDELPTGFYPGPFPDMASDDENVPTLEEMVQGQKSVYYPKYTLLRLNGFNVHEAEANQTGVSVRRTFVKIQFTERLLERDVNTINPNLDYKKARVVSEVRDGTMTGKHSQQDIKREELEKRFADYEGEIYYPAGRLDLKSLEWLAGRFPKVSKFVFTDDFTSAGKNDQNIVPGSIDEVIGQMRRILFLNQELEQVVIQKTKRSNELNIQIRYSSSPRVNKAVRGKRFTIRYVVKDLFKFKEKFEVVFLQTPGWAGKLSFKQKFWDQISSQVENGGYVLVSSTMTGKSMSDKLRLVHTFPVPKIITSGAVRVYQKKDVAMLSDEQIAEAMVEQLKGLRVRTNDGQVFRLVPREAGYVGKGQPKFEIYLQRDSDKSASYQRQIFSISVENSYILENQNLNLNGVLFDNPPYSRINLSNKGLEEQIMDLIQQAVPVGAKFAGHSLDAATIEFINKALSFDSAGNTVFKTSGKPFRLQEDADALIRHSPLGIKLRAMGFDMIKISAQQKNERQLLEGVDALRAIVSAFRAGIMPSLILHYTASKMVDIDHRINNALRWLALKNNGRFRAIDFGFTYSSSVYFNEEEWISIREVVDGSRWLIEFRKEVNGQYITCRYFWHRGTLEISKTFAGEERPRYSTQIAWPEGKDVEIVFTEEDDALHLLLPSNIYNQFFDEFDSHFSMISPGLTFKLENRDTFKRDGAMIATNSENWRETLSQLLDQYDNSYEDALLALENIKQIRNYFLYFPNNGKWQEKRFSWFRKNKKFTAFLPIPNPGEYESFVAQLGEFFINKWAEKGWNETFGYLSPYLAKGVIDGVPSDYQVHASRSLQFISHAPILDRQLALWAIGINIAWHVRDIGPQVNDREQLVDRDVLTDIVRQMIPLLIAWEKKASLEEPASISGSPLSEIELAGWTYRDFFLLGLSFMLDPLIYHLGLDQEDSERRRRIEEYYGDRYSDLVKDPIKEQFTKMLIDLDEVDQHGVPTGRKLDNHLVKSLLDEIIKSQKQGKIKKYNDLAGYPSAVYLQMIWGKHIMEPRETHIYHDAILDLVLPSKSWIRFTGVSPGLHTGALGAPARSVKDYPELLKEFSLENVLGWVEGLGWGRDGAMTAKKTVLVVDDEREHLFKWREGLEARGYEVEIVKSGDSALYLIERDPEKYSLVITDLKMPGMSGEELIKTLADQYPSIPVIWNTLGPRLETQYPNVKAGSVYKDEDPLVRVQLVDYYFFWLEHETKMREIQQKLEPFNAADWQTLPDDEKSIQILRYYLRTFISNIGKKASLLSLSSRIISILEVVANLNKHADSLDESFRAQLSTIEEAVNETKQIMAPFSPDLAMTGNETRLSIQAPGGIDLNANQKVLEQKGDRFNFLIPTNPAEWDNVNVNGFVPVIINITPLMSLPMLLGEAVPKSPAEPMNISSLN